MVVSTYLTKVQLLAGDQKTGSPDLVTFYLAKPLGSDEAGATGLLLWLFRALGPGAEGQGRAHRPVARGEAKGTEPPDRSLALGQARETCSPALPFLRCPCGCGQNRFGIPFLGR